MAATKDVAAEGDGGGEKLEDEIDAADDAHFSAHTTTTVKARWASTLFLRPLARTTAYTAEWVLEEYTIGTRKCAFFLAGCTTARCMPAGGGTAPWQTFL